MEGDSSATLPLRGLRVVDLSSVLMVPFATQQLADLGADVIVVEPPTGASCRALGPGPHPHFSGMALNLLRNKRHDSQREYDALFRHAGRDDLVGDQRTSGMNHTRHADFVSAGDYQWLPSAAAHGFGWEEARRNAPEIGLDSAAVLAEAGLADDEIDALVARVAYDRTARGSPAQPPCCTRGAPETRDAQP